MRNRLGWSTGETADKAREYARLCGDEIKLSQQLVSKFENGKAKSIPRWLGYVQLTMAEHLSAMELPAGQLWDLPLPAAMRDYFQDRTITYNDKPVVSDSANGATLTAEERDWLNLMHSLGSKERHAVRQLITALAGTAVGTGAPTP